MSTLLSHIRITAESLHAVGAEWALIGALAVSVYTEPRTTKDIDIAVAVPTRNDEQTLIDALLARGFRSPSVLMHIEPTQRLGMRLQTPASVGAISTSVDILSSSSGIEREVVAAANVLELLPALHLPVASVGHLIAMKLVSANDADRLKDKDDLRKLLKVAGDDELADARGAIELIEARGYSRGLDLSNRLAQFRSQFVRGES